MCMYGVDSEITYADLIKKRIQTAKDEYMYEVESLTRDINLNDGDLKDGILTDQFFERNDIKEDILNLLLIATATLKDKLEYINS